MKNRMGRILYAPDGTEGGDSGAPAPDVNASPAGDAPPRTFTQEDLDRIVGERAKHAKSSAISDLLKELGYEKPDELKAAIKRQRDAEAANQSELEKAQKAATEAQTRYADLESRLRNERIGRDVERTATRLSLEPELAARLVTADMLEFDDNGVPTNTEAVLKGLIKKWPNLVKGAPQPHDINGADGRGQPPPPDPKAEQERIRRKYRI